jgi:hypothetical protein
MARNRSVDSRDRFAAEAVFDSMKNAPEYFAINLWELDF